MHFLPRPWAQPRTEEAFPPAPSAAPLQRLAGDYQLLDLAGPFVDPEQPDVAVEPLDPVIGDIAGAAEYLHRAVGDPADNLAGEIFGRGRLERDRLALVLEHGCLQHQRPRRHRLGLGI